MNPWQIDRELLLQLRLETARRHLRKQPALALVEVEEMLDEHPNHPLGLFTAGRAALKMGDASAARAALLQCAALRPMDPTVLAALTIAAFEDADLDLARTSAQRAVRVEDRLAPAWYYLGLVHERTGNPKQAAHAFQRAHAIDPDTHPLPLVLTDAQWLEASEHAQANLPPAIQAFYVQVPLVWEPYPDRADLQTAAPALNPLIGALFVGVPPLDGDPWKTLPQAVRVFTGNLKHALPSGSTLIDRLSHALLQEALSWTGAGIDDLLTAFPTRR